jgi:hypothetical protein
MDFADRMKETAAQLWLLGHVALLPNPLEALDASEALEEAATRKAKYDLIRRHWAKIREADAVLVLNYDKNGVAGYVGGNTFLEIGFAHVLLKGIFLLYPVPEMPYAAEILATQPVVLDGDLGRLADRGSGPTRQRHVPRRGEGSGFAARMPQ